MPNLRDYNPVCARYKTISNHLNVLPETFSYAGFGVLTNDVITNI